ncbi:MAG: VanZ family protein [Coriobacteriaceae bacterium]|nr:VanZ family protein [Coriobacteriaceae bacterium]
MKIYSWNLSTVFSMMLLSVLATDFSTGWISRKHKKSLIFAVTATILSLAGLYAILHFTVLTRTPSDAHIFMLSLKPSSNEFVREMVMNAFLFFPFGLFLPYALDQAFALLERHAAVRKHSATRIPIFVTIAISFLLTIAIESWQYYAGTGTAQLTDVICNTLGAAIGTLSFALFSHLQGTHRLGDGMN